SRVVRRHDVRLDRIEPEAPLQIGNGSFAMAVDATGLQTFPDAYPLAPSGTLLGTHAVWAWHALPNPNDYRLAGSFAQYDTPRGTVPYVDLAGDHDDPAQRPADGWLRGNPHRLDLGRVGLWSEDIRAADELGDIDQHLELWTGCVHSRFTAGGIRWGTTTAAHPARDAVAVSVRAPHRVTSGIRLRFPY